MVIYNLKWPLLVGLFKLFQNLMIELEVPLSWIHLVIVHNRVNFGLFHLYFRSHGWKQIVLLILTHLIALLRNNFNKRVKATHIMNQNWIVFFLLTLFLGALIFPPWKAPSLFKNPPLFSWFIYDPDLIVPIFISCHIGFFL